MTASWRTLFVPLARPAVAWTAAALVLVYDLATSSFDLSLYDSAELSLVAVQLGLGHPIGQPLHALAGFVFAHLPGVAPLVGLTLLSALPHALTVLPVTSLAESFSSPRSARGGVLSAIVIVAVGLHWPIWESATRIEVYALGAFFVCLTAALFAAALRDATSATPRALFACGLSLGLTGAVNAYFAMLFALALAPTLLLAWRAGALTPRAFGASVLGGLLGLLPYAYVPLVAGRTDVLVWGAPTDAAALADYFRGADYAHNRGTSGAELVDHAARWLAWSIGAGVLWLALSGVVAHLALGRRSALGRATAPLFFLLSVALLCSHAIFEVDIPDYVDYLAPGLWLLGAGTAAVIGAAAESGGRRRISAALGATCLVVVALLAPPSATARTRHADHTARMLAAGALDEAPRGAVLVVAEDHWAAPLLYLQEIEHRRTDVVVLPHGLASSSWLWEHLFRRHPDLHRIALRGPGGATGRILRFLAANPGRAVHASDFALAAELGAIPCSVGYLARLGRCAPDALDASRATHALARELALLGEGSPGADSALSAVALSRGELLWRSGRPGAALAAFLAGVPPEHRPPRPRVTAAALALAPPLRGPLPHWQRTVALGDPARDLELAAYVLVAAGARDEAERYVRAAAALGLPEAIHHVAARGER